MSPRRVAVITGAGQGLGRSEAIDLARHGTAVVVNDVDETTAAEVVDTIESADGEAITFIGDCSEPTVADALVATTLERFGRLDAVVNNAGFNRDRTMLKMSVEEWEDVITVHLRGHFAVTQRACRHFRDTGTRGRIVCTTSTAGILGNFGQANYGAAKAGIAAFAIIVAEEMARHGVTCNAIAPAARTRMTAGLSNEPLEPGSFDFWNADNVAPLVSYLCSDASGHISGKVFGVQGDTVELYRPYTSASVIENGARRWEQPQLAARIDELFRSADMPPGPSQPMASRRFKMI